MAHVAEAASNILKSFNRGVFQVFRPLRASVPFHSYPLTELRSPSIDAPLAFEYLYAFVPLDGTHSYFTVTPGNLSEICQKFPQFQLAHLERVFEEEAGKKIPFLTGPIKPQCTLVVYERGNHQEYFLVAMHKDPVRDTVNTAQLGLRAYDSAHDTHAPEPVYTKPAENPPRPH